MSTTRLLAVARGDEPADVLLAGGRVVDVFAGDVVEADVAIAEGRIAGVGPNYRAHDVRRLDGRFVCPGLIDAHVHVESALITPAEFAAVVVPHGVTAVVSDPHEIANVLGLAGVRFMRDSAAGTPLTMLVNASSCVPATGLATAGAAIEADDLRELRDAGALGLAEMMDFPAVVAGEPRVLRKIEVFEGRPRDGHCPQLAGPALNAYAAAGLESDHECTTAEEALDKLRAGLVVFIREGSLARDLQRLLPLVTPRNERRFCFCTDDRHVDDLLDDGSVDRMVRLAVANGMDPPTAVRLATLNVAEHFRLRDRGAIAPGRVADLVVADDLEDFRAREVWAAGRVVARDGRALWPAPGDVEPPRDTVRVDWPRVTLGIPAAGRRVRVIGVMDGRLRTECLVEECRIEDGRAVADPGRDLLKAAVIERHRGSGRVGLGFVRGFGLRRGALSGTIAHDHHNLIVVGADDDAMLAAARAVAAAQGGLAAAEDGRVRELLPLPVAGLMSDRPHGEVAERLRAVLRAASGLGSALRDPFTMLSFIGLEVIPRLKLTDRGLVDVDRMQVVDLFAGEN